MTVTIGLTGSIATGKTTVSTMFRELNIPVVDADLIAREVVEIGKPAYKELIAYFGEEILESNKKINRKKLGAIVFSKESERKKLNEIMHPAIRKEMLRQKEMHVENKERCIVLDIPLLFESNLFHFVDQVLVVYTDETTQLERLIERDQSTEKEALQRIQSQISVKEKAEKADKVIDNSGSIDETYKQLKAYLQKLNII